MSLKIFCKCGCCEGIIFKNLNGQIYISFVSDDFYSRQELFGNIRNTLKMFCGKRLLKDILVTEEDLINIKQYLLNADYKEETPFNNDSHINVGYDEDFGYSIYLFSDLSKKDIILLKTHRAYQIVLSKKERNKLVKRIDKILKENEKRTYITL